MEQTLPVLKVLALNPSAKTQKGVLGFKIMFDVFPSGAIFKNIVFLWRLELHSELRRACMLSVYASSKMPP